MLSVASASAGPQQPPEEPAAATFDDVSRLLVRARSESDAARKKTLTAARRALVTLTGSAARPVVVAKVRSLRGREETWLLPKGTPVEVVRWPGQELSLAGQRARTVGDAAVTLHDGQVSLWSNARKQITADTSAELLTAEGDRRFVLVKGRDRALLLDTSDGSTRFEGPSLGATLTRGSDGITRLLHRDGSGATRKYARVDLPDGKESEAWSFYLAESASGRHVAVGRSDDKGGVTVSVLTLPDLTVASSATLPPAARERTFTAAVLSADGTALASLEPGEGAKLLRMSTGKEELVAKEPKDRAQRGVAFTSDGASVCVDAPGAATPRAKLVPGTFQRCYPSGNGAQVAHLGEAPPGWRRATREDVPGAPEGATFETISPDGSLVAALLFRGNVTSSPELSVAVYDAKTGRQKWNQFIESRELRQARELWFSDDGKHLMVDGVRVMSESGEAVDGKPADLASLDPLLRPFGVDIGVGPLVAAKLVRPFPSFPSPPLILSGRLPGLGVHVDPTSGVTVLQADDSAKVAVFAKGRDGGIAYLPDGSFSVQGDGEDLACQFGPVLAPIEVCRASGEVSAPDVGSILRDIM